MTIGILLTRTPDSCRIGGCGLETWATQRHAISEIGGQDIWVPR
jgi:hypothetical protein